MSAFTDPTTTRGFLRASATIVVALVYRRGRDRRGCGLNAGHGLKFEGRIEAAAVLLWSTLCKLIGFVYWADSSWSISSVAELYLASQCTSMQPGTCMFRKTNLAEKRLGNPPGLRS